MDKLTQEIADKYYDTDGNSCPFCLEEDSLDTGELESDGLGAWRNVGCGNCGQEWQEDFEMVGISSTDTTPRVYFSFTKAKQ